MRLDRHLALALLRHIRYGTQPTVPSDEFALATKTLRDYLDLRSVPATVDAAVGGVTVPLILRPNGREIWVDLHHPLIDPQASGSAVAQRARAQFKEVVQLDVFTLLHDLPAAVDRSVAKRLPTVSDPSIYELLRPTAWARPPRLYSYSSLRVIASCPRRWLLLNSRWGVYDKFPQRIAPAAIEGQIVHEALDRLAKALGRRGRPEIGSAAFTEAVEECGFWEFFKQQVAQWNSKLAQHPRSAARYVLRTSAAALGNRAVRLLRDQYRPAEDATGVQPMTGVTDVAAGTDTRPLAQRLSDEGYLTEVGVEHPVVADYRCRQSGH